MIYDGPEKTGVMPAAKAGDHSLKNTFKKAMKFEFYPGPCLEEKNGKKYVVHMSPHNHKAVMMRVPYVKEVHGDIRPPPPPPLKPEPIFDFGPSLTERFRGLFKGPMEKALEKDLAETGVKKRKGWFRSSENDFYDEIERRLTEDQVEQPENKGRTLLDDIHRRAEEKAQRAAIREALSEDDLLDPVKIKEAAAALPDAQSHEIMQWGWDVEKMFARRQDELHGEYITGGVRAKSHTGDVTSRIKEVTKNDNAGFLRRAWLRVLKWSEDYHPNAYDDAEEDKSRFHALLSPKERFATTLGFIADLERAVEEDITIAQEQLGFCSEASQELDYYYKAIKSYERELKRARTPIIEATEARSAERFDPNDEVMRQMHEREILDAGRNVDNRAAYLETAVEKCRGEYGVYVSGMEHADLTIESLQTLLRERLPKLERDVKRGMKILDDQDAIKARAAGRGIDVDIEFELTPAQAETELKSIAAQVTLQIDVIEKVHAAIVHDEALAIEGKELKALLEARETLLIADQRPLALPAPSKPSELEA